MTPDLERLSAAAQSAARRGDVTAAPITKDQALAITRAVLTELQTGTFALRDLVSPAEAHELMETTRLVVKEILGETSTPTPHPWAGLISPMRRDEKPSAPGWYVVRSNGQLGFYQIAFRDGGIVAEFFGTGFFVAIEDDDIFVAQLHLDRIEITAEPVPSRPDFMVLAGPKYYPMIGTECIISSFPSIEEAQACADRERDGSADWYDIVDLRTMDVIRSWRSTTYQW